MAASLLTKQWKLSPNESQTSFDVWIENITFHLSTDSKTARFLPDGDLETWSNDSACDHHSMKRLCLS